MLVSSTTKKVLMDTSAAELEIQSLMQIDIFDYDVDGESYEICESYISDADYSREKNMLVDSRMLGLRDPKRKAVGATAVSLVTDGGKFYQLLAEHTILSEAFLFSVICSCFKEDKDFLAALLSSLKNVWTQPQWEACLGRLCCIGEFRRAVLKIVKFFEEELEKHRDETAILHQPGQQSYSTLISLIPLIITPLLKLLQFLHALWMDEAVFHLPKELREAKSMMSYGQFFSILGENSEFQDVIGQENELGQWLQLIRESGYNFLGLCAHAKGAFTELLSSSSLSDALMENLGSMEFRHVTKLIDLVMIPFVKHCPRKLWEEWMLKLLRPLFSYCVDLLFLSWFNLLNGDGADVSHYFGYLSGSEETVKEMENYLLLDFTRKVSKLLGVLASPRLNDSLSHVDVISVPDMITTSRNLKCEASSSVVRYILLNDCFERLSMNLFGWWVDGEATIDAIPFCKALVQVVVATNNEKLRRFIEGDMVPAVIRRLCDDLPCAVQRAITKLSNQMNTSKRKMASEDLLVLCQDIYELCVQNQDLEGGNGKIAYCFEDWFAKQKEDLFVKASWVIPEDFPAKLWNWEFEEEFQMYLPNYIDLLHEIDAMEDCLEYDSWDHATLFDKLSPEFKTRHAIKSCMDHHMQMISDILQRKEPAAYYERRSDQMVKWLCTLITSKPYIKVSDARRTVMDRLRENFVIDQNNFGFDAEHTVDMFLNSILRFWEPHFHPLIRKDQEDMLIKIARQFVLAEESKYYKPLQLDPRDFKDYLQPYASSYIYRMKKESGYFTARDQVKLHEEFDRFLASGKLDEDIYKFSSSQDDFVEKFADKHIANSQFVGLDQNLIKFSLEQRAQILNRQHQMDIYSECLRNGLKNEKLKDRIEKLMGELEVGGFFDVNNNSTNWKKRSFVHLVGDFEELVFGGHCFPRYLVIQGVMDFWEISQRSEIAWEDSFREVFEVVSDRWREDLAQLWRDTRYYEGLYYDLLRQPLKKIFPRKVEAPKDLQPLGQSSGTNIAAHCLLEHWKYEHHFKVTFCGCRRLMFL